MCGIVGIYNYKTNEAVDKAILKKMNDTLYHRGPDGEGYYFDDDAGVALGHRRLSIIDIDGGHQPLCNEDESIWTTYNGEIYNHKDLKKKVNASHSFRTDCDTEVLVHAYEEWGEKFVEQLNGIFAFAIWDKNQRRLMLVRDPFGVKPLYYFDNGSMLIFASEIKAILAHPAYVSKVNIEALNQLFTYRFIPSPLTGHEGIKKLLPGHSLTLNPEERRLTRYWQPKPLSERISFEETKEELGRLLSQAIQRQLMSDVPLSIYLSGGIDSSFIALEMKKHLNGFTSLNMEFEDNKEMNEGQYAREVANAAGSEYIQQTISVDQYLEGFDDYMDTLEEPITNFSGIAWLFLSQAARSAGMKVALSGQGSDELFGGYDKYIGEKYHSVANAFVQSGSKSLLKALSQRLPSKYQRNNQFIRAIESLGISDNLDRYNAILSIFQESERKQIIQEEYYRDVPSKQIFQPYLSGSEHMDHTNKFMYLDSQLNLVDNLLMVGDKTNMRNSVEMRVPFLDLELVQFCYSMPTDYKIKFGKKKYIYKKYLEGRFDKRFINRKKIGFYSPVEDYFTQKKMRDYFLDMVKDPNGFTRGYLKLGYVENLLDEHLRRTRNHKIKLFQVLMLELWHKKYFNVS